MKLSVEAMRAFGISPRTIERVLAAHAVYRPPDRTNAERQARYRVNKYGEPPLDAAGEPVAKKGHRKPKKLIDPKRTPWPWPDYVSVPLRWVEIARDVRTTQEIAYAWERFVNWVQQTNAQFAGQRGWDAAWRNCAGKAGWAFEQRHKGGNGGTNPYERRRQAVATALDQLAGSGIGTVPGRARAAHAPVPRSRPHPTSGDLFDQPAHGRNPLPDRGN